MSTCHTIAVVDSKEVGDNMELEIMKAGQGYFKDGDDSKIHCKLFNNDNEFFKVLKNFEFDSNVQRMSVLAQNSVSSQNFIFSKGNPEKLKLLCKQSTIPDNYEQHQKYLSDKGYRVLAVAAKNIAADEVESLTREKAEFNMDFLGFIVLENKLKEKTAQVIHRLNDADILCCMITGDNIYTATAIARECKIIPEKTRIMKVVMVDSGISVVPVVDPDTQGQTEVDIKDGLVVPLEGDVIDPIEEPINNNSHSHNRNKVQASPQQNRVADKNETYVIDGETLELVFKSYAPNKSKNEQIHSKLIDVISKCRVYARTTPEQKRRVVELMKIVKSVSEDTLVAYCGDGANDTMALKEADVGISLSLEEASLAAPFISTDIEITSVESVLIEGRAALNCYFQNLKYFLFYCMTQTAGVMCLLYFNVIFSVGAYLWMDSACALPMTAFLAYLPSALKLFKKLPPNSLLKWEVISSFVTLLILATLILIGSLIAVSYDSHYIDPETIIDAAEDARIDSEEAYYWESPVSIFSNF